MYGLLALGAYQVQLRQHIGMLAQVNLHFARVGAPKPSRHIPGQQLLNLRAFDVFIHGQPRSIPARSSNSESRLRAWNSRVFTVFAGICRTSAASEIDIS